MIRLWPWTTFDQLEKRVLWYKELAASRLASLEIRQACLFQAWRDLAAANKGIRRLKAKLAKYEKAQRPHD
jgi:hypothetical protein